MKKLFTSLLVIVLALTFSSSVQAAHYKHKHHHSCDTTSHSNMECPRCGNAGCLYYKKHWINPCKPGVTMNYYGTSRPSYMSSLNNPHEYYRGANFYGKCGWQPKVYTVYYRTDREEGMTCHHRRHKKACEKCGSTKCKGDCEEKSESSEVKQ